MVGEDRRKRRKEGRCARGGRRETKHLGIGGREVKTKHWLGGESGRLVGVCWGAT